MTAFSVIERDKTAAYLRDITSPLNINTLSYTSFSTVRTAYKLAKEF